MVNKGISVQVSCDEATKVIKVAFCGTVSLEYSIANITVSFDIQLNPIKEKCDACIELIGLHKGTQTITICFVEGKILATQKLMTLRKKSKIEAG